MTSVNATGSSDSDTLPDSTAARSRTSLISLSRCPRLENLGDARRLRGRRQRRRRLHQLGEAEDRVERAAQLMAHAREEIRFGEVGFIRHDLGTVRHDLGTFQLDVRLLERLLELFSLRNIARGSEYALKLSISVVKGGGVVGYHGFLAVSRTR